MIEVLDDEMSFEDDAYTSALYRMRQSLKRKKSKRQSALLAAAAKPGSENDSSSSASQITFSSDIGVTSSGATATTTATTVKTTSVVEKDLHLLNTNLSTASSSRRNSRSADDYAERMRTAAVMLAQLQLPTTNTMSATPKSKQGTEQIRQRIIKEMIALEEQRMTKMKTEGVGSGVGGGGGEGAGGDMLEDEQRIAWVVNKEDPSGKVLAKTIE